MNQSPSKPDKDLLKFGVIALVLAVVAFIGSRFFNGSFSAGAAVLYTVCLMAAIILGLIAVFIISAYLYSYSDYERYQENPDEYFKHKEEQLEKADKQRRETQRQEEERLSKLPACPICGSKKNVKRISSASRAMSATAWGLGSVKIGKQYECTHCKHFF
ncbi:MAG: hypothetical protein IKV99_04140 [Oscillospiraceae bacterium]|nr:hypothetical protein [Oscillospiraceae bacterium]